MILNTLNGGYIESEMVANYFSQLINLFFKILPMRENGEPSLQEYMQSLQYELIGCKELISAVHNDASYLSLMAILQYFITNPDCELPVVRREVFHAINICKRLSERYKDQGVSL